MQNRETELPFLGNIGLIMTYKCQVRCPHCILDAGPHRTEEVNAEEALDWIRQITAYENSKVIILSLTGGEPFYDIEKLRLISDYADTQGLYVSAVTNAYWASSPEEAARVLAQVPAIRMLSLSTDVYHQRFIPFQNIKNAIRAIQDLEKQYTVAVCMEDANDPALRKIREELLTVTTQDHIFSALTFPVGRAMQHVDAGRYPMSAQVPASACVTCSSPILFPDGHVVACIGPLIDLTYPHALYLGNIREESLQSILDRAQMNPILHVLRVWGPRKLIQMLQEAGYEHLLARNYVEGSICSACYQLFSNPQINELLLALTAKPAFMREVAYARLYYMNESQMAQAIPYAS